MEKTLAVNAGSSSLKWQLYAMPEEKVIAKGIFERIGLAQSMSTVKFNGEDHKREIEIVDHRQAVLLLMDELIHFHLISEFREITGIGHRVVAGGELFKDSVLIDKNVLEQIKSISNLAPLHNPANAAGIEAFMKLLPDAIAVAVFDTAFHTSMPEKAYRYPIPNKYYRNYSVRKYGAHGTSHMYVSREAAKYFDKPLEDLKIITAHIGNGASITAVDGGKSVDTSMGFTPLGGVMMGTRSGEMDPSVIPFLLENDPDLNSAQEVIDMFNNQSGIRGVSELSSDMRDLEKSRDAGDANSILAYEMFVDRLKKYISQYFGVLNGADALVFTAGIGENDRKVREDVVNGLSWFGMEINPERNYRGVVGEISTADSKVKVLVIPTDEELVIARDVEKFK
ncbi:MULTISPECIES: acetate kinase [unclassified Lactococcus]|uniref:acetate kinase n=1 Tax=unclassified Lactococcus TaxID=2643510 RepID=UPI0011C99545|nr:MULTISPECIES: acetate kinase [unclassified Lactococcus]MQW22874.1 acetate/propionate family kinase [Lactococcus sp. dk101]TXK44579.1 acetate kinase [Lactococcus sp. dk310]TXK50432.1 acetate kinase [Lactococcus sp. dk322]